MIYTVIIMYLDHHKLNLLFFSNLTYVLDIYFFIIAKSRLKK